MLNQMRKIISITLILLLFVAGCGSQTNKNSQSGDKVEIEFWHSMSGNLGKSLKKITDDFNKKHENIHVKLVFLKDYPTITNKLQLALRSNNAPALVQLEDPTLQTFAASGHLQSLNEMIEQENVDLKDYVDGFVEAASVKDQIYGLPLNRSVPVLYYNKEIFEKAGIDPSRIETWEGVQEVSKELVKKGEVQYGFEPIRYPWFFSSLVWSNGAELSNDPAKLKLDTPESTEALQLWGDMIHKDKVSKVHYGGEGWAYWYDTMADLTEGKAAMVTGSTADMGTMDSSKIGAAFMPKFEGNDLSVPIGGTSGVIPKTADGEQKKAAFEFIKYFSEPDVTAQWATETGYLPVRFSAKEKMSEVLSENPNYKVAIDELKYARPTPLFPNWNQVENEAINKAFDQVFVDNVPADKALKEAQIQAEKMLKK
ncbi:ABC transporter substrate-binding protein [Fictibacillus nanhaiensis]|uniref:ABC transporter substrate-binding protein n=1 Tax=Fictibacillus nanhaiensis TaxID=742169 RepID=UPI001C942454|nr:ABC transporter substrate-binding protein [Fictibacillus nanhaiensis]MBY6036665.1 ABC transporter substrate-binding protein [Fictibacillus nanhaiensis]